MQTRIKVLKWSYNNLLHLFIKRQFDLISCSQITMPTLIENCYHVKMIIDSAHTIF